MPVPENVPKEEAPKTVPETKTEERVTGFDAKDIEANKYVAALSYIGILFLVPLLVKKDSPFAQFHAKQGLVLCVAFVVGSFVFWIPLLGWAAFAALFIADVVALVQALSGKAWEVPLAQDIVKKINI